MQALEFDPDYPDALNLAGRLLIEHGRVDNGIIYLKRALAVMPTSSEIHFNIANALVFKGEPEKALTHFKEALRLEPANEKALVNTGVRVIAAGQIDAAIAYFERAVQIDPQFEEARLNLARAKEAKRRFDAQKAALEAAGARQGHSPELNADFGDLYLSVKNFNRAAGYYLGALEERPDYSRAANNLAVAYALQGRLPEAIRYFQKVAALNPNSEKVYYNLACVYSRNNDIQKALTALKKAVSMGYDNWRQIKGDPDLVRLRASSDYQGGWPRLNRR
jgi:tetratricopeptide (TPR) repeat protein